MIIKPILSNYKRSDGTYQVLIYIYDHDTRSKKRVPTTHYLKKGELSGGWVKNCLNAETINGELGTLMDELKANMLKVLGIPKDPATLKMDLLSFFEHYIKMVKAGKILNKVTKQPLGIEYAVKLESSRKLLESFIKKVRKVSFNDIDEKFHTDFVSYLRNDYEITTGKNTGVKGMAENTISKAVVQIKTVMRYARDKMKLHSNTEFESFVAPQFESDQIALNPEEIEAMLSLDTSGDEALRSEQLRFAVAYNFFLRYNDSIRINEKHIIKSRVKDVDRYFLRIVTGKTRKEVIVPIRAMVYEGLKQHNFKFESLSNSNSNDLIKELGRRAGINSLYTVTEFRKGKKIETTYKKYELIGTHTTRRSAATNYYLATKDLHGLMILGGWTSLKQVVKYLRIGTMDNALKASELDFFS